MKYRITPIAMSVHREDESAMTGEGITHVTLTDEGGGPFVLLEQFDSGQNGILRFEFQELREIWAAAETLLSGLEKEPNE